jgi:hypothetical protein
MTLKNQQRIGFIVVLSTIILFCGFAVVDVGFYKAVLELAIAALLLSIYLLTWHLWTDFDLKEIFTDLKYFIKSLL